MKTGLCTLAIVLMLAVPTCVLAADLLYSCAMAGSDDFIDRGFYIENFNGLAINTVSLSYTTLGVPGTYTVHLTAREGTYDGAILGSADATFDETGGMQTFDFNSLAISHTMTICFIQTLTASPSAGLIYYDAGPCDFDPSCPSCAGVFETEDTTPPLSAFRRASVGLMVTGQSNVPVEIETWGRLKGLYR